MCFCVVRMTHGLLQKSSGAESIFVPPFAVEASSAKITVFTFCS